MSVDLHVQSAFSFLRGASSPERLAERAAELGLRDVCLIDRDGVYGAPRFFRAARAHGVRPMVGASVALRDGAIEGRLALLVTRPAAYKNLCALVSLARMRVTKADAREGLATVTLAELAAHKDGLIAMLLASEDPLRALAARSPGARREHAARFARAVASVFGRAHTVIEVGRHRLRAEERRTQRLLALARALGVPAVASSDARYADPHEARLYDVLTCIREHTTVDEAGKKLPPSSEWGMRSPHELRALFRDLPEPLRAAERVAERCEFTLEKLGYEFPDFALPPGETAFSYLHQLTTLGARERYKPLSREAAAQIARELDMIAKLDLAGYFLIVWDIVRFCRAEGILTQGRGSAANSAVCYALGITAVDPVGMELLFERFLSEERGEWPDIDLDLPSGDRRERVIQYVYKTYGARGAAMTANVITYRARSAVREVARALGFAEEMLSKLSHNLGHFGTADRDTLAARVSEVGLDVHDARTKLLLDLAGQIQHLPRHLGQHSGGMVIARGRLDQVVPIEPAAMPGRAVIQWDKDDCADLGILKIDLLGLGMMAVLEEVVTLVNTVDRTPLDLAHLPHDDPETYATLQRADTIGMFQVESRAQMATLPRMHPERFYDLVIEVALIRPGPIVGKMVHPYLDRRAGRAPVVYPHPSLEPILKRTLGVPLFQEQLMRVAMAAAGFTGGEAEELRRAMGSKRSVERMAVLEARLRAGMSRNGFDVAAQDEVVRGITSFALYGFPESHAASFALLAYASAYIKTHFTASYTAALLNHWPMGFYHPATVVKDAQRHGVRVLPIDVTRSGWACTRENLPSSDVRLGLRYVRGLREASGRAIEIARTERPFASMDDLRRRTSLRDDELDTLAELGALATVDPHHTTHRREALWQVRLLTSRPEGLLTRADLPHEPAPLSPMTLRERIAADFRASGMSVGPHPIALVRDDLAARGVIPCGALATLRDGGYAAVAGVVITRQRPATAKGFFFVTIEDESGIVNAIVRPGLYEAERRVFARAPCLILRGIVQQSDGVTSLKVTHAEPFEDDGTHAPSHDFH